MTDFRWYLQLTDVAGRPPTRVAPFRSMGIWAWVIASPAVSRSRPRNRGAAPIRPAISDYHPVHGELIFHASDQWVLSSAPARKFGPESHLKFFNLLPPNPQTDPPHALHNSSQPLPQCSNKPIFNPTHSTHPTTTHYSQGLADTTKASSASSTSGVIGAFSSLGSSPFPTTSPQHTCPRIFWYFPIGLARNPGVIIDKHPECSRVGVCGESGSEH